MIFPPPVSFVLAGISGFWGSEPFARTIAVPSVVPPPVELVVTSGSLLDEHAARVSVAAAASAMPLPIVPSCILGLLSSFATRFTLRRERRIRTQQSARRFLAILPC